MKEKRIGNIRYGMAIDIDRCTGCGACTVACAVENNIAVLPPQAGPLRGVTWMRVDGVDNGEGYPTADTAYFPIPCQHCDNETPCVGVCPQNAIDIDPQTGTVSTIPGRCLGCRYCMTACPYHARYYTWWDPKWTKEMEKTLSPDVSPRMRGIVEKCNLCHGRWQAARQKAAVEGKRIVPDGAWTTACAEACPNGAIHFGNLMNKESEFSRLVRSPRAFRLLERVGTAPKVYYLSDRKWVRDMCEKHPAREEGGAHA